MQGEFQKSIHFDKIKQVSAHFQRVLSVAENYKKPEAHFSDQALTRNIVQKWFAWFPTLAFKDYPGKGYARTSTLNEWFSKKERECFSTLSPPCSSDLASYHFWHWSKIELQYNKKYRIKLDQEKDVGVKMIYIKTNEYLEISLNYLLKTIKLYLIQIHF